MNYKTGYKNNGNETKNMQGKQIEIRENACLKCWCLSKICRVQEDPNWWCLDICCLLFAHRRWVMPAFFLFQFVFPSTAVNDRIAVPAVPRKSWTPELNLLIHSLRETDHQNPPRALVCVPYLLPHLSQWFSVHQSYNEYHHYLASCQQQVVPWTIQQ